MSCRYNRSLGKHIAGKLALITRPCGNVHERWQRSASRNRSKNQPEPGTCVPNQCRTRLDVSSGRPSSSVNSPFLIAPTATSREIAILCQKEKNKIPLTHRNLACIRICLYAMDQEVHSRTGLNGFRSSVTHTQNIARQLFRQHDLFRMLINIL